MSAPAPVAQRIVSLAPSFTETLVAIGAGDRLVGIGKFDPDVPGRPDVPRLGDASTVSLETLIALRPDLVIVNSRVHEEKLSRVGLPVYAPATDRLDDVFLLVTELGRRTGRETQAAAANAGIRRALGEAKTRADARRAGGNRVPRVLVVVQRRPMYVAGGPCYLTDLLGAIGAANAMGTIDQPWPSVSEESAVASSPDVILDASIDGNETGAGRAALAEAWSRFPSIPAVRDGRVTAIREDGLFRAGPGIPEALARLEELVYGAQKR